MKMSVLQVEKWHFCQFCKSDNGIFVSFAVLLAPCGAPFARRNLESLSKEGGEVARRLESCLLGDERYGAVASAQQPLDALQPLVFDGFANRLAAYLPEAQLHKPTRGPQIGGHVVYPQSFACMGPDERKAPANQHRRRRNRLCGPTANNPPRREVDMPGRLRPDQIHQRLQFGCCPIAASLVVGLDAGKLGGDAQAVEVVVVHAQERNLTGNAASRSLAGVEDLDGAPVGCGQDGGRLGKGRQPLSEGGRVRRRAAVVAERVDGDIEARLLNCPPKGLPPPLRPEPLMGEGVDIAERREVAACEEMSGGLPADVLVVVPDEGGFGAARRKGFFADVHEGDGNRQIRKRCGVRAFPQFRDDEAVDTAGVAGLYDVVSGKIYYNKRSGKAFTVSDTDAPDTLLITGSPASHGSPSPGFGPVVELGTGDSLVATCPAVWTNADETIAATCTGWKLYDAAGTVVSNGVGNAFTYVHPGAARRLEWQLDVRYKVRAGADAGGAAAPAEQWVAHGGSATVAATPDSGFVFQKWTEANTGAAYEVNPLGVSAVTNLILTAHFGNITNIFVAPEGRGEMTGASWSNALGGSGTGYSVDLKAAIEGAIAEGAGEVNVRFAGGDYPTPAQLALSSLTVPIRFCGGYAAEADGSLEKGDTATTLTSTNGAARLLAAGNLPSFTIQGITFSNCAFANSSGAAFGGALHLSSCTTAISNCVFTGNSTKSKSNAQSRGGAIYLTGGSLAIADCEFRSNRATCNGSNGFERGGALCTLNASLSVSGCTFTGNNASGRDSVLSGGAINVNGGDAAITNCTFTQNYAQCSRGGQANGGALSIRSATRFTMSDSVLERNYCATAAYVTPEIAGCYFDDFNAADGVMTAVVTRCVFDSRSLPSSEYKTKSDILLNGGRLTLANCLIFGASGTHSTMTNSVRVQRCASELSDLKDPVSSAKSPIDVCELELVNVTVADGAGAGVVRVGEDADLSLRNCIVHGNAVAGVVNPSSISYSCVQEAQDGVGNFVADPHWTGAPYYHLLTKRAGGAITNGWFSGTFDSPKTEKDSPCLDAGAPDSAGLPLEPKPHGPRVNLGAYGGSPGATKTLVPPGLTIFAL